jgi:hypothetical protein
MTLDIHEYGRRISETDVPQGTRIAIVCSDEDYDQFSFDTRAVTTGLPVFPRIFTSAEEGVRWLTK